MGLFSGGALKRKVASLTEALDAANARVAELESKCGRLEHDLSSKDESFRVAKEGRQKAEKKLDKLAAKSMNSERKLNEMNSELNRVKADLTEYRDTVLSARAESDRLKAKLARHTKPPQAMPAEQSQPTAESRTPEPQPVQNERQTDRRVVRLQEQLENERAQKEDIKGRALRAEQAIRDSEKRRASDAGKVDAKLREAQHALQSERKAYKILQLQYEGLLESQRGHQQKTLQVRAADESSETDKLNQSPDVADETADALSEAAEATDTATGPDAELDAATDEVKESEATDAATGTETESDAATDREENDETAAENVTVAAEAPPKGD